MLDVLVIGVALAVGFVLGRWRSRHLMEHVGEAAVRRLLTRAFQTDSYHLLNNVTLPTADGTTQIDHILVSSAGVFVIETKHYSHWLFADSKSRQWTQVLAGGKKFQFQNPLQQNYKHLKVVQSLLGFIAHDAFYPVVVFTGSAKFKTSKPEGVFTPSQLVSYINSKQDTKLTSEQLRGAIGQLEHARYLISKETDIEHQANLEQKFGRAK
jgi:hypothetical protein